MKRALITGPAISEGRVAELRNLGFDVINGTSSALAALSVPQSEHSRDLSETEMISLLNETEIYIYGGLEVASGRVLEHSKNLKLIAFLGTGWSDEGCVDAAAAKSLRISVANTPGANAPSVAEVTMGILLALQRQIVELSNKSKRGTGRPVRLKDIAGKTLGIVGLGQIGSRVARHAVMGFGMKVIYTGPHEKPQLENELGLRRAPLAKVLAESDFVTLHCPARSTVGLIGAKELALMKPSAFLLNLSSPEIVDGHALVDALESGRLAGAGFDGWYKEPASLHRRFLAIDDAKLIVLPRTAWLTDDSYDRMTNIAFANIHAKLNGMPLPNQVNP